MEVFPVFYDVDPSDVRKQEGTFAKAFAEHEKENIEKVQTWRVALRKVANLSGWHLRDRSEAEVIQDIVKVTFDKLRHSHTFLVDTKKLVGINSRVEQLMSHLAIGSKDVRIVGIWGIGGMGKTTLARVVYDMVFNQFEACGFIDDVRVNNEKHDLLWLQKELLKKLLICKDIDKKDVNDIDLMLKNRLRHKKILLVLDDVNESKQLDKLVGSRD
ncbi:disease resistance protein Roq1-like [Quercus robur]|uniref:disease resistance protein Roq1-like n=1 Tax=Quercus robur TaxID=38942 RepID=UPI002162647A|nr:disease resistance protein Roq1-like [Quercus robur]